jgi:cytochrome c551/c552
MAEGTGSEQLEKRVDTPEPDPIADRSFSAPLLLFSLLMIGTLVWALYDEVIGQRPWKDFQSDFVSRYSRRLKRIKPQQRNAEAEIKQSDEYVKLNEEVEAAESETRPRAREIEKQIKQIDRQVSDITDKFQNTRAWIAAKNYQLETTESESSRNGIRRSIEEKKNEPIEVSYHNEQDKEVEAKPTFTQLEEMYNGLRDKKAQLVTELIKLNAPANEARQKRDHYLQDNLVGLTEQQVGQLINKMDNFEYRIKQIHVAEANIVDRCESCHLGVREPITLTAARSSIGRKVFVSHPEKDLLKIHDPDRFGCSTCHGGNGRATVSTEKGHGRYEHWLWPLYYKENVQAGCNQCHNADRVTPMATTLNRGKDLFQNRGCVGCHRYEGFDRDADALSNARQSIKQLELDRETRQREIAQTRMAADQAQSDEEAAALLHRVDALRQTISQIDAQIDQYDIRSKYLMQDVKRVGPNLKEVKAKLRRDWIPVWLADPQAFRPGTKMPTFRLDDEEIKALSAFVWQSALGKDDAERTTISMRVGHQPTGDAAHGKEVFKSIGCLACHSIDGRAIDMGDQRIGGDFAADLSRVGEKANYDYIVRWVHNPRERIAPYSPSQKKDLMPADYQAKNLPFRFGDEFSKSPVDGRELLVQNMTVMPNFRLSDQDARDVATFLTSWRRALPGYTEPQYPDASFMDDTELAAKGERLAKSYGCAGCHEIRGLEDEQRIGTELTPEGSKPLERLDFALLTEEAKSGIDPFTDKEVARGEWYDHKGFFEYKLRSPGVYDKGKERVADQGLRMPNIYLEDRDIDALTTFLLGSVVTSLPQSIRYNPAGGEKQVQDGWWVVQKYNCMGCHNVLIGQDSILMGLPQYQGADGKEQLPPRLTSEGARVNPDWLLKFLRDPSLTTEAERPQLARTAPAVIRPTAQSLAAHMQGGAAEPQSTQPQSPQTQSTPAQPAAAPPAAAPQPSTAQAAQGGMLMAQPGMNRNGVRRYLKARMPTFNFSPNELQAIVNFFMGASSQQQPYIPEHLTPLTADEQGLARALFTSNAAPCLKCHMTGDPGHDALATAPNFLASAERLKPGWTQRWLLDPQLISPGTSMPSELFKRDDQKNRWVFNGPTPPTFQTYEGDHVALLVRYMFQLSPDETRRLGAGGGAAAPATPPPATTTAPATGTGQSSLRLDGKWRKALASDLRLRRPAHAP